MNINNKHFFICLDAIKIDNFVLVQSLAVGAWWMEGC